MSKWPYRKHHYPRRQPCIWGLKKEQGVFKVQNSWISITLGVWCLEAEVSVCVAFRDLPWARAVIVKPRPQVSLSSGLLPLMVKLYLRLHMRANVWQLTSWISFHTSVDEWKVQSWIWTAHVNIVKIMQSKYLHLLYMSFLVINVISVEIL